MIKQIKNKKIKYLFDKYFIKREAFTVAELLVAVGLFTVIISISIGSYIRMIQQQRLMTSLMAANDNVSLALEQMMREIRTGKNFTESGFDLDKISFVNDVGCDITYSFTSENSIDRLQNGGSCEENDGPITSENIKVQDMSFDVESKPGVGIFSGTNFELVTIRVEISNEKAAGVEKTNKIETKVSARKYFGE